MNLPAYRPNRARIINCSVFKLVSVSLRPAGRLEKRYTRVRNYTCLQLSHHVHAMKVRVSNESMGQCCYRGYARVIAGPHGSALKIVSRWRGTKIGEFRF